MYPGSNINIIRNKKLSNILNKNNNIQCIDISDNIVIPHFGYHISTRFKINQITNNFLKIGVKQIIYNSDLVLSEKLNIFLKTLGECTIVVNPLHITQILKIPIFEQIDFNMNTILCEHVGKIYNIDVYINPHLSWVDNKVFVIKKPFYYIDDNLLYLDDIKNNCKIFEIF